MSFTPVGTMGTTALDASANTIVVTPTGTIPAGSVVVASFGSRSIALTEFEETNTHTALVDTKGNVWSKFGERTNSGGFAGDGQCGSMWWCQLTTALLTSDAVTLTMSASVARRFGALRVWSVGVGEQVTLTRSRTAAGFTNNPNPDGWGLYWVPLVESLFVCQVAYRANAGGITYDTDWTTDLTELSASTGCFWGQHRIQTAEEDTWSAAKSSGARWVSVTGALSLLPLPATNDTMISGVPFLSREGGSYLNCERFNDRYPQYDYVESIPSPTPFPGRQRYHLVGGMVRADTLDEHVARLSTPALTEPYSFQRIACWRSDTLDTTSFVAAMCAYLNGGPVDGDWDVLYLYAGLARNTGGSVAGVIGWVDAAGMDHVLAGVVGIPMALSAILTAALRIEPATGGGVTARLTVSAGGSPSDVLAEIEATVPAALLLSGHNHTGVYVGAAAPLAFPLAYGGVAIGEHEVYETIIPTPIPPCSLVLRAYEDDRTTVRWEIGTDPNHANPYLMLPDQYDTQELDVAAGRATIGTVTVGVIDPMTVAGDQDSGLMTSRLAWLGLADIVGRRFVLLRYISDAIGFNVVKDGPAGNPMMASDYSSFRWAIRDTRETERELRMFQTVHRAMVPDESLVSYGYRSVSGLAIIDEARPIRGHVYRADNYPQPSYMEVAVGISEFPENGLRTFIWQSVYDAIQNGIGRTAPMSSVDPGVGAAWQAAAVALDLSGGRVFNSRMLFRWRLEGSSDPWTVIPGEFLAISLSTVESGRTSGNRVVGRVVVEDVRLNPTLSTYDAGAAALPDTDDIIEFVLEGPVPVDEQHPYLIDGIQAGTFVKNCYDGIYSDPDPVTQAVVPSGIRYEATALAQMTSLVRLRQTEPVMDGRAWLDDHIYAPDGWVPALNDLAEISPVSQVPPTDMISLPALTNVNCEPAPEWNGGEQLINVVRFRYKRDYADAPPDRPPDPVTESTWEVRQPVIGSREIIVEYRHVASIQRNGERVLEIDGSAFTAVGRVEGALEEGTFDPIGPITGYGWAGFTPVPVPPPVTDEPVVRTGVNVIPWANTLDGIGPTSDETGWQLGVARGTHLLPRYALGAPTIGVKVRREDVPTMRNGSWDVLDLSWLPDYITGRRGLLALGQVVALGELDCNWRYATVEVVVPPELGS